MKTTEQQRQQDSHQQQSTFASAGKETTKEIGSKHDTKDSLQERSGTPNSSTEETTSNIEVPGTPFRAIGSEENGYTIALGNNKIHNGNFESIEEIQYLWEHPDGQLVWNITCMLTHVMTKDILDSKPNKK